MIICMNVHMGEDPLNHIGIISFSKLRLGKMVATLADDFFKCISLNENLNFKENFTEIYSLGSDLQYGNIGSGNGLAPKRRQAII